MNNNKIEDAGYILTEKDINEGHIIFQRGKKKFFLIQVED